MKRIIIAVILALTITVVGAIFATAGAEVEKSDDHNYCAVTNEFVHDAHYDNTKDTTSIGAELSYTKASVSAESQYVATEMTSTSAKLGAGVSATVTDDHTSAHCGVTAEAKMAEAGGMIGNSDYGMIGGSLEVGVGGHLNVDYDDGHLKVDVGAALGFGGSVKVDVNVGGFANACSSFVSTVCHWFW